MNVEVYWWFLTFEFSIQTLEEKLILCFIISLKSGKIMGIEAWNGGFEGKCDGQIKFESFYLEFWLNSVKQIQFQASHSMIPVDAVTVLFTSVTVSNKNCTQNINEELKTVRKDREKQKSKCTVLRDNLRKCS